MSISNTPVLITIVSELQKLNKKMINTYIIRIFKEANRCADKLTSKTWRDARRTSGTNACCPIRFDCRYQG